MVAHILTAFIFSSFRLGDGGGGETPPPEIGDPYWDSVVLALKANGENGSSVFTDVSNSAHSVSAIGAKVDYRPNFTTSCVFDGTGDYLTVPNSTDFDFGTDDWTIEFWYNWSALPTYQTIYNYGYIDAGALTVQTTGNQIRCYVSGTLIAAEVETVPRLNQWYFYSLVKENGVINLFRDGVLTASAQNTVSISSVDDLVIGARIDPVNYYIWGEMDELRVTKGVARPSLAFTPETLELPTGESDPYWDDTVLLLKMEGTNGSTTFNDSSQFTHPVTANGDAQVSTAQAKFGSSSALFDGNDYLQIDDEADLELGSGDFTIECWCYNTSSSSRAILSQWTAGNLSWFIGCGPGLGFYYTANGTSGVYLIPWTTLPPLDQWVKISVVREGQWVALFVDGQLASKVGYIGTAALYDGAGPITIGDDSNANAGFYGYIDEVRITKKARHSLTTEVPTDEFPADNTDPHWDDVKLLAKMDGAEGSTTFTDSSQSAHNITAHGNAKITKNSQFDGNATFAGHVDEYLSIPDSDNWSLDTHDFTLEFWFKTNVLSGTRILFQQRTSASNYCPINILLYNTTLYAYFSSTGTAWLGPIGVTGAVEIGKWHHLAVVRNGSDLRMYLDGTSRASMTSTADLMDSAEPLRLGGGVGNTSYSAYVDVDDLRLTKGVARYTSDFTPPESFPTIGTGSDPYANNVILLLNQETASFSDTSLTPANTTANSAVLEEAYKKWGNYSAGHTANSSNIVVEDDGRFQLTTEDWTVEMWVAPEETSGFISGRSIFRSQFARFYAAGTDDVSASVSFNNFASSVLVGTSSVNIPLGTFVHIAMTRKGSIFRFFLDGALVGTYTNATAHNGALGDVSIGGMAGNTNYARCYSDGVRVTAGVARYTGPFTPPPAPFADLSSP